MSNSKIYYFSGPCAYAKVFEHNRDMEGFEGAYKEHDGMYSIMVGLNPDDIELMLTFNRRYEPKKGDKYPGVEGEAKDLLYLPFRRKHTVRNKEGEVIHSWGGAPEVIDSDNNKWDDSILIGNGSIVTVKVSVTPFTRGKGSFVRLEKIRVDELKEFEGAKPATVEKLPDDEVPF